MRQVTGVTELGLWSATGKVDGLVMYKVVIAAYGRESARDILNRWATSLGTTVLVDWTLVARKTWSENTSPIIIGTKPEYTEG